MSVKVDSAVMIMHQDLDLVSDLYIRVGVQNLDRSVLGVEGPDSEPGQRLD
jgi:hypothetical protein